MATESVTAEQLPPIKFTKNACGIDAVRSCERATAALNGVEAIASVISANTHDDNKGFWSDELIYMLHEGEQALLSFARQEIQLMSHELWFVHAHAGDYGPEAQARAKAELTKQSSGEEPQS